MQYKASWKDLTKEQQHRAVENYRAIREIEEEKPCSLKRAKDNVPYCRGFWLDTENPDFLEVDI